MLLHFLDSALVETLRFIIFSYKKHIACTLLPFLSLPFSSRVFPSLPFLSLSFPTFLYSVAPSSKLYFSSLWLCHYLCQQRLLLQQRRQLDSHVEHTGPQSSPALAVCHSYLVAPMLLCQFCSPGKIFRPERPRSFLSHADSKYIYVETGLRVVRCYGLCLDVPESLMWS